MIYRRRELWLLLVLATSLGVGLAVSEFRRGLPDLAERLENLDTAAPSDRSAPASPAGPPARPQKISEAQTKLDGQLNLNRATAGDLRRLPGVGPTLAGQIIRARERQGPFTTIDDLLHVPGMGSKKFERIRDLVTVREQ
ncbi:MAG: helix-hairpin-helix domain-containing protein [Candidatus Rokubacteria bacterium]|nr:helix-hairpin-helix domain-containing protein [Candidatus Rokubacteria bacterium]